jgi:hypothetical protein
MGGFYRAFVFASVTIACALTIAQPALAEVVWAKAGGDPTSMQAEYQDCTEEAHLVGVTLNASRAYVGVPPVVGDQLVGMIVGAGFSAALTPKARSDYLKGCMYGRGYGAIALSASEEADFEAQKTLQAQAAWISAFYRNTDFNARRAAVLPIPQSPPERVSAEPFTVGAVRIDPAALTLATGELDGVRAILSGPITHRATGRISKAQGFEGFSLDDGLIVQKAVVSGPQGANQTYWCGRISKSWPDGANDHCLWEDANGVLIYSGRDTPWLDRPSFYEDPVHQPSARFSVVESSDDLIGPMDFGLYVEKITATKVRVLAQAKFNDQYIDFWAADLPFDADGKAVLPSWSYRLTLTRSGAGVVAALTKDGDGAGWETIPDTTAR